MVKLAKAAKGLGKPKKAAPPPPKDVDDSEEEDSEEEEDGSSEEEAVPQKKAVTPAKASGTPGKKGGTPGKKGATPAKPMITPGKKAVAAKNGKKAQKKDSDEDDDDEEEEEEEDEDESESEEETPPAKKPTPKKPAAKPEKPSKKKAAKKEESDEEDDDEDDEEDDDSEDAMDTTPAPAKVKPAAVEAKESSDEDEEDDDEDDDDEDEEEKVTVKDSGKRKKEVPKQNTASEAKKPKTEGAESFSLFVGNLNAEKDFDELKDAIRNFFTKKNLTVSDVRLGQTKKFGYVDFSTEEDLEKAVELSGKKILGVETKMEKARSKEHNIESKKERNLRTIFVKNLPYSTTSETLQELFENAVDVRLPVGGDGSSRGIAYIEFKSEAEAEKALEERQGADVDGRTIILDFTGDKAGKTSGDQKVLVINNLAYSVTESALQEVFEKAVSCKIPQNNQGRPKGFAFVEFTSIEDCKEALKTHNNTEIEGRAVRLELKGAQQGGRGAGSGQSKTLFVRGLSEDTTEESLREAFDGAVGSRIATDRETGSSKGFGFVDFSTVEDAKAAKEAMEDGEIDGNKVTLDFAKPKGDGGRGGFGRGGGGRGFGRGRGFGGGYGGGRGGGGGGRGGGGRGGGRGFGGGYGGGRGGGGGGFRGGNRGKKIRFDD